jgi:hypothetical protein
MPDSFRRQLRAFPTYPQPHLMDLEPFNGAYYWPMGPGQSWRPMGGQAVVAEGRDLSSLFGPTASRLSAAAAPEAAYADLMGQQILPWGASEPTTGQAPYFGWKTPVPAEIVVDIDPETGEALSAAGRPAYDVAFAEAKQQAVTELSPVLSNRPMPSITATAQGEEADCGIGGWADSHKALAVLGAVGLYFLLKGGR